MDNHKSAHSQGDSGQTQDLRFSLTSYQRNLKIDATGASREASDSETYNPSGKTYPSLGLISKKTKFAMEDASSPHGRGSSRDPKIIAKHDEADNKTPTELFLISKTTCSAGLRASQGVSPAARCSNKEHSTPKASSMQTPIHQALGAATNKEQLPESNERKRPAEMEPAMELTKRDCNLAGAKKKKKKKAHFTPAESTSWPLWDASHRAFLLTF
jgi:hypothetical protein